MRAEDWPAAAWIPAVLVAFVISAVATRFAIGYAHRRRLMDYPGARRSHTEPTPRGGGVGIVIAVLVCVLASIPTGALPTATASALAAAIAIVASVGWIDDHRGLAARWRFLAHCLAAIVLLYPAIAGLADLARIAADASMLAHVTVAIGLAATVGAIVWSINLHNFMDGIDGILSMQAIFVFAAIAGVISHAEQDAHAIVFATFASATVGFLIFNFPRARIFMGDVGSGVLGLLIAFALLIAAAASRTGLASGLILCSAFVVDASCTLLSRMLRGRRWYSAHREHLYQWIARVRRSHKDVVALYAGWNFLVAAPVVWWINTGSNAGMSPSAAPDNEWTSQAGFGPALAVYVLGVVVWLVGKRRCIDIADRQRHAAA